MFIRFQFHYDLILFYAIGIGDNITQEFQFHYDLILLRDAILKQLL